jgi:histidinol-phosphate aminotransferase
MMSFNLSKLIRKNIAGMKPYSSARNEYDQHDAVLLDANENPFNEPYNRYPDPLQKALRGKLADILHLKKENIFVGNGSDEAIDLIMRIFCNPGKDSITSINPSYGMYEVLANINNVEFRKVSLNDDFSLNAESLLKTASDSKIIFLCSPNNPTANILDKEKIKYILYNFKGIVVLDEAYIDFSLEESWCRQLDKFPNLVVLRTLSKAYGLAGIRLGMALASLEIIDLMLKIKYPYNINALTLEKAMEELEDNNKIKQNIKLIIDERNRLISALADFQCITKLYPSEANFILAKTTNAKKIYQYLVSKGIVVRDRSSVHLCEECLRITVGTSDENEKLLNLLKDYPV